ncbi:hypothetical protein ABDK00_013265 [Niabella insulamsoli]|uniref:hypothetical protein n=1 Tax=Niabella insulamsoli TaxID=3144874 RepID=UPI0031FC0F84
MAHKQIFKMEDNLPFNSTIFGKAFQSKKTDRSGLIAEEKEAAYELLNYCLNKIDKDRFATWAFDVIQRLAYRKKSGDAVYFLSNLANRLSNSRSQDEIIRFFNGYDYFDNSLNLIIESITHAFYEWWRGTSDPIETDEFDDYFVMVRHLIEMNKFFCEYSLAGSRLVHLESK